MNVVSFCIYGKKEIYRVGALRNIELCKKYYPGWEVWFYLASSVEKDFAKKLKAAGATVYYIEDIDSAFFTNYRYFACADIRTEYVIFRDTDSRIDEREAAAVKQWIKSDYSLHIMRDHPWHGPDQYYHMMLGGMWGVDCKKLRDAKDIILNNKIPCNHGYDQFLITKHFWPRFANDYLAHDEFFEKTKWPLPRIKKFIRAYNREMYLFTGCQYGFDDQPTHPEHVGMVEEYLKAHNLLPE